MKNNSNDNKTISIIYGAGKMGKKCLSYIGHADFFCDVNADKIGQISNVPCVMPSELAKIQGEKKILIAIANYVERQRVRRMLLDANVSAEIVDFVSNLNLDTYSYNSIDGTVQLRIHIVYSEDSWIFGKFANKLKEEIEKQGHICTISDEEDPEADINHYIPYALLRDIYKIGHTVRTTMITHIETIEKRDLIELQAKKGITGICMSSDTMCKLQRWGIDASRICYVNPAHDGDMSVKKVRLGITNRCYSGTLDYRKRDDVIVEIMKELDTSVFQLWIMGEGWDDIVEELRRIGLEVDYNQKFDRDMYIKKMPQLDYWLYFGFDEGAMGFLDALSAGVQTIATPQGFHLDTSSGLTYACNTIREFIDVLQGIQDEKRRIVETVKDWTWDVYAMKHLEIWRYLTKTISMEVLHRHQSEYVDGIFSLPLMRNIRERNES